MRVLGIDPGSETLGWGVVEGDSRRYELVAFGTVKSTARDRFSARLLRICEGVEAVIAAHAPDILSLEDSFYGKNVAVAIKLGQVRGVVLLVAERAGLAVNEYAPRLVKQTVVGYGNAEKRQTQEMVRILLKLKVAPAPLDAADALSLAICHFHHCGQQRILAAAGPVRQARAKP